MKRLRSEQEIQTRLRELSTAARQLREEIEAGVRAPHRLRDMADDRSQRQKRKGPPTAIDGSLPDNGVRQRKHR